MNSIIKRINRALKFKLLQLKVKDFVDFNREVLLNKLEQHLLESNKKKLEPHYAEYVQNVSSPAMAASLELAAYLYTLCTIKRYTKLLDMGSGLSSFVFRLYAKENPEAVVYSVDDDGAWLEKTKTYLKRYQLNTENMYTLQEFIDANISGFDCILHDMNFVEVRIKYVDFVIKCVSQNGIVIMDDVHKPDYRYALLEKLKGLNLVTYTLKPNTVDSYGRYAFAVLKK